jgi:hypothetical protein
MNEKITYPDLRPDTILHGRIHQTPVSGHDGNDIGTPHKHAKKRLHLPRRRPYWHPLSIILDHELMLAVPHIRHACGTANVPPAGGCTCNIENILQIYMSVINKQEINK